MRDWGGPYEMPKPYDDAMKKLVGGNPEDFLSWVLRDAIYTQRLPYELHPESIYADGLIEAVLNLPLSVYHRQAKRSSVFIEIWQGNPVALARGGIAMHRSAQCLALLLS